MDRHGAYAVLAAELDRYRRMPYAELAGRVGRPPVAKSIESRSGPLVIEVRLVWAEGDPGAVRVHGTADGPSWWRLERLEEAITVSAPTGSGGLSTNHYKIDNERGP